MTEPFICLTPSLGKKKTKKPTSHADWFTERRAAALSETDRCIIASSGRRWWVSKAVSCHRNPQRTIQRKQHRRLSGVISTHPLSATPPSHTHTAQEAEGDVWCEDRRWWWWWWWWCRWGQSSESSSRLADVMCQKRWKLDWVVLFCSVIKLRSGQRDLTVPYLAKTGAIL